MRAIDCPCGHRLEGADDEELFRVLAPGGRLQIADVTIQRPVSEEGRRNIDLWTG